MTATTDFDGVVASWLQGAGPTFVRNEVVEEALVKAGRVGQRRGLAALVFGPAAWPSHRSRLLLGPAWRATPVGRALVPILVGALLLAVAVAAAALVGAMLFLREELVPPGTGYNGVILRPISAEPGADLDVVFVARDGGERVIRRLAAADLPDRRTFYGSGLVSLGGWLAAATTLAPGDSSTPGWAFALIDLDDPGRMPGIVRSDHGAAWGAGDRFATAVGSLATVEITEAESGRASRLTGVSLPGGGPDIVWTTDGSGLLAHATGGGDGEAGTRYVIRPIDGGRPSPVVPPLAFGRGARFVAAGGSELRNCAGDPECGQPTGTVAVVDADGEATRWYEGELARARVVDASFSDDGSAVWLLLLRDQGSSQAAVVVRLDSPGTAREIAAVDLGPDLAWAWFEAFAPDDSAIAIGHWTGELGGTTAEGPVTLIRVSDGSISTHPGRFAGFARASPDAPTPTLPPTPDPTAAPVPSAPGPPTPAPQATAAEAGSQPCAAMLQLLATYPVDAGTRGLPPGSPTRTNGARDILATSVGPDGTAVVGRFDASSGVPRPSDATGAEDRVFPSLPAVDPRSRIVPSPDGRAVAVEEGDLGAAGCGDPIIVLADGGRIRPFPAGAFELVSDLAWAPSSSALFAVRRRTIDASRSPFRDPLTEEVDRGPGTVLRWDAATGEVAELGGDCGRCMDLRVSPDGARLLASDGTAPWLHEPASGWRRFGEAWGIAGGSATWVDATSVALNDEFQGGRRVTLDGTELATWGAPCCHGTGFGGPVSPDGSTMADVTLSRDFLSLTVVLLDLRAGSTRTIWSSPEPRGCTAFEEGSSGRAECEAANPPTLGPDAVSGYARVVAWAPDGRAVLVLDQQLDTTTSRLVVVPVDGSGPRGSATFEAPDLSMTLGFPNVGAGVAWLPGS